MKKDKEVERNIKRYYRPMFRNLWFEISLRYDDMCEYYHVNIYKPRVRTYWKFIVDDKKYKLLLNNLKKCQKRSQI